MKHKTETERYSVPFTVDGKTHNITKTREIQVPALPRDRDADVLNVVIVVTCVVVVAAMVWSTVSIGSMLNRFSPAWAAYMIAGVFDLAWIVALATEWLSRYQPDKARRPRRLGWMALAISMAAIFAHGAMGGGWIAGAVGAVVSAVAKAMWMLVMHHQARELTDDHQQWVDAEMSEANALLAVTVARRQVARVRAQAAREMTALESSGQRSEHQAGQVNPIALGSGGPEEDPSEPPEGSGAAVTAPSLTGAEALRRVPETSGDGRPLARVVRDLLGDGVKPESMVAEVLKIRPDAKPDSIRRTCSTELRTGQYL